MKTKIETSDVSPALKKAACELLELDAQCSHLKKISALLLWDQELNLPRLAVKNRAEQLSFLEVEIHKSITQHRVAELLHVLGVEEEQQKGNENFHEEIRLWLRAKYREWKKHSSVPPELLAAFKKETSLAFYTWCEAKQKNSFSLFQERLRSIVQFNQEIADCLGYEAHRYDALLDQFEPEAKTEGIASLFASLTEKIVPLYNELCDRDAAKGHARLPVIPIKEQRRFLKELTENFLFSKDIGHLGESAHPFSVGLGENDHRITTHYKEDNILSGIFSVLHEMGHAFYDHGVSSVFNNTICGEGASYGIHESQSRFFENVLGKHVGFWKYWYPRLCKTIPSMSDVGFEDFIKLLRRVTRSPLRVEADEVGYTLHVVVRFELERALIEGSLSVEDLPEAWNEKYANYLGIVPKNDSEGVLQDVHWAEGYFAYFPSYALGNIYAATLYHRIQKSLPRYGEYLQEGSISECRQWLVEQIHQYGGSKQPKELLPLRSEDFLSYIHDEYVDGER